ncbi:uncharacterized protein A4U43_C01F24020 [Asparagus officinalis]|uniref:DUF8003 domain-containing protein n=1 Tax=Asparagus officinalis TaxID=4686 RepID=A0A5P1FV93_ASPOF|nr:uncharacterized protein A4U43_C01F24020 [Asparagus officinalis]
MCVADGAAVNTTALGGDPPEQTSGAGTGTHGDGGGHGGRGASCYVQDGETAEESWGGDVYAWDSLTKPWSFGSKGGSTSLEMDYGGGGGGRIMMVVKDVLEVNGVISADGGDGGWMGGGGSGGSIHIIANKLTGNGNISASGGNGVAGGGGGRVAIDIFSRHDEPKVFAHGGISHGCPENSGAAGTLYDAVPRSLIICNNNLSSQTDTLLLTFPNQPLWTNVFVKNRAKVDVPLLWSRVQVQGQLSLLSGGVMNFGLKHYPFSEFELMAEELLMSNSVIKVFGALRMSVKMLLMWNSRMVISAGGDSLIATSILESSNLVVLRVGTGSVLRGPLINASDEMAPRLACELQNCPVELIHPPEDCNVNSSLAFTLQICRVEDIDVAGRIEGTVIHFNRARSVVVHHLGMITASGFGCKGGVGSGKVLSTGLGGGGGHGGKGGDGFYNGSFVEGGIAYGSADLPCELGSGSGNDSVASATSGGGIIGDEYLPVASINGSISTRGGLHKEQGFAGENGTVTGKDCPRGLYGIFCKECPVGTFKNATGSDRSLCHQCPSYELPHRAMYITVRGGVSRTPCPYKCVSERYRMPHCYTAIEELIFTFGGPWPFGLLLLSLLVLLALVMSVARVKFVGGDELPGPAPTQHGTQIDHSFPFLESLNEVMETNRVEESQTHNHRMYFMGSNTFSEPWHLPHSPPEQVVEIVYEDAFNRFVDEVNVLAAYQWWEGSIYGILCILAYPFAWSWQQWRRRKKLQRLREFVRSEYDHACLRSCRSRALYEGLKVAATPDLMLAYVDFYLGGDEKRPELPPRLYQRFPMCIIFGGDGTYMAPFSLHSDNVLTSLMSQCVPPTIWYRLVAGLNAHLRLVRRGYLRLTLLPVLNWLQTHANPALSSHGVCVNLAWFQATASGYCQFGLVVSTVEKESVATTVDGAGTLINIDQLSQICNTRRDGQACFENREVVLRQKINGGTLDSYSLRMLEDRKDILYPFSLIVHNSKPIGQQDLVGLVISILLLGDFSLVLLTLLQLYSFSLADVFLVLFILPLGILSPFPAGISALFSHGPRRSAGLARVYALWNTTSLINVIVAFMCGFIHYKSSSRKHSSLQPWSLGADESGWWLFPTSLLLCKCIQARLVDWHVANLEIQDRSLYSKDPNTFWKS